MDIKLSRRHVLAYGASAIAAGAVIGASPARAQQTTIRIGHVLAPTHQFQLGLELAAKSVAAATDGRVAVEVFPSSQLGTERDMNVAIRTGGIEGTLASPGGASVHLKELAILDAPYLFRDNAHWQAVVYGPIGEQWGKQIVEQSGVHILGWFHRGTRHVLSKANPYNTIADIGGQKIRVADLPPYPQVFEAFGAIPTPIAFAEMYQALDSGIVDGADAPLDTMLSQKLFEVSNFVNLISWSFAAPGPVLLSDAAWQSLSPEDQQALVAAVREGSQFVTDAFTNGEEDVKQQLTDAGMTLSTPSDLPAWQAAAAKAIPDLAETWGGDVLALRKDPQRPAVDVTVMPARLRYLPGFERLLGSLEDWAGMVAVVALAVVVNLQIFARYIFHHPFIWPEEMSRLLLVWMTFFGAAALARRGGDLAVDTFVEMLPRVPRRAFLGVRDAVMVCLFAFVSTQGVSLAGAVAGMPLVATGFPTALLAWPLVIGGALVAFHCLLRLVMLAADPTSFDAARCRRPLHEHPLHRHSAGPLGRGIPVAASLLLVGIFGVLVAHVPVAIIGQRLAFGIDSFTLIAHPHVPAHGQFDERERGDATHLRFCYHHGRALAGRSGTGERDRIAGLFRHVRVGAGGRRRSGHR